MPTTTGIATEFIQFSRTSNATVTDSDGKVKWAPHNFLLNSESFDTASWTKGDTTVNANSISAPNATTTADKIVETATTAQHFAYQSYDSSLIGVPYTFGIWLKGAERTSIQIELADFATGDVRVTVDLSAGTIGTPTASGNFTSGGATISNAGSGWYYVTLTSIKTAGANVSTIALIRLGIGSYLGVAGSGIYAWGAALYRSDLGGMQPNTSAYPLYSPTTPKNLLGFSESLTTGWTNTNTTDAIAGEVNPNGLTGAVDVAATAGNGTLLSSISLLASPYTFSIWLKRKTGSGTVEITVDGTTYVAAAVTNTWTRFSTTLTPAAGTVTPGIRIVTSGDAVYAWGAQLSSSASLDPYFPSYSTAPTAAAYYGPRRDFNGSTLACNGLLVEEQRTNFRTYSSDFTQSSVWTLNAGTTVNSTTLLTAAPSGAVTAQAIVPVSNGATNGVADETGLYATGRVFSFYAKAGTGITVITGQDGAGNIFTINLSTGTGTFAAAYTYNSVVSVGNGWYRVAMNCSGTGTNFYVNSSTGANGTNHFFLWGVQLEAGSFATSYMPTAATTFQRNTDVATVSTQAFPYSQTEGTIVVSVSAGSASYGAFLYSDMSNYITTRHASSGTAALAVSGGATQANFGSGVLSGKTALAYKANDYAVSVNGAAVAVPTPPNGVPPAATLVRIGAAGDGIVPVNGHIRQVTYLPRRISNAELIARST